MAVNYQLPPQLSRDYDVAGKFLSGVQIGASIGEARNRLQAASDQAAMEATQKQQQIAANALKDAQQLEVQKAYNDQQVQLKQQQLQAVQEKVGQETLKAARQYAAQQQYQKDYQLGVEGGLSKDEAARNSFLKNIVPLSNGAGMANAMKLNNRGGAPIITTLKDSSGKPHALAQIPGSLAFTDLDRGGAGTASDWQARHDITRGDKLQDFQMRSLERQRDAAQKALDAADEAGWGNSSNATVKANYAKLASRVNSLDNQLRGFVSGGTQQARIPNETPPTDSEEESAPEASQAPAVKVSNFKISGAPAASAPATATAAAPAAQAPAPKAAVQIPGISATKPVSIADKNNGPSFAYDKGEVEAARKKYAEQGAAQSAAEKYDATKKQAYSIYSFLKAYQANPDATTVTPQHWQAQVQALQELLPKLTEEDQKALTGQNDLE